VSAYLLDHDGFSGVPPTTFVEVVHNSLKYVPFTGLEVTSDTYFEIMSSLIQPSENFEDTQLDKSLKKALKSPDSEISTQVNSQNGA
jgi:hypothetical protein